jgi:hypothetical protein
LAANLRHESLAVKSTGHRGLQPNDFCGIVGSRQALGQIAKFVGAELPMAGQFKRVLDYFRLVFGRKAVNFRNDFRSGHGAKLRQAPDSDKLQSGGRRHDRPGQRPAPRFVHARDKREFA